jgi:hypothetical protein
MLPFEKYVVMIFNLKMSSKTNKIQQMSLVKFIIRNYIEYTRIVKTWLLLNLTCIASVSLLTNAQAGKILNSKQILRQWRIFTY